MTQQPSDREEEKNRVAVQLDPAKHPLPDAAQDQEGNIPPSHEASLMNFRTVIFGGIGIFLMILLVLGLAALPRLFIPRGAAPGDFQFKPQQPTLQVNFRQDVANIRATENAHLNGYGYVDQAGGVVQIPIQAAMERVAGGARAPAAGAPAAGGTPAGEAGTGAGSPEAAGAALFQQLGCGGCHQAQDSAVAPTLVGIFGQQVTLEGGQTVTVDEAYLRNSIVDPHAQIVQGFQAIMPDFSATLSEDQINSLIAYIQSLKAP